jgi:methylmalonyl-CoA mutase C-terminal domain/subunit
MVQEKKIRVLIAKPGLDGHDKGAIILSSQLRDAGMEVIYTGLRRTADQIVQSAIQEDVDVIGLSILSGAHMSISDRILRKMKEAGIEDKVVVVGGVIPDEDIPRLKEIGIAEVFTQKSSYQEIIDFINNSVMV